MKHKNRVGFGRAQMSDLKSLHSQSWKLEIWLMSYDLLMDESHWGKEPWCFGVELKCQQRSNEKPNFKYPKNGSLRRSHIWLLMGHVSTRTFLYLICIIWGQSNQNVRPGEDKISRVQTWNDLVCVMMINSI